jgi:predicted porin
MNKKLLAIAIAGVLAAPLAQAQTANVTLYGRINIDAEVIINAKTGSTITTTGTTTLPGDPPPGTKQNLYRVSSNSSRFGVRGTESLGGGLNAIFQIESNVSADSSGGQFATRETFAGLQGGWGTLKLGYFLTPYDDIQGMFGSVPTLMTGILGSQGLWANGGAAVEAGGFDARVGNSVRYDSPNIAGFTGSVQLGARDGNNTNPVGALLTGAGNPDSPTPGDPTTTSGTLPQMRRHAYILSTGGQYNNGPIQAGITYEVHNNVRLGTTANPKLQDQAFTVAGSYNFGIIKIGAAYEQIKYDVGTGGDLKRNFWAVSGTGNLGPGQYYIAYFKSNDGTGSSANGTRIGAVTKGDETGAQQWEISYTYPLSKRTLLYTGYTMIDNDKNGAYNFGVNAIGGVCQGNGAACGDAAKPQGLVLGMVHFF